jgi:hypothetical protein
MFVRGTDSAGSEFLDLTKTLDISATGAYLASPRAIRTNQIVNLTIPAPSSPSAMLPAQTPPIRARVRRHRTADGIHLQERETVVTQYPQRVCKDLHLAPRGAQPV